MVFAVDQVHFHHTWGHTPCAQARLYVDHQLAARGAVAIGGVEAGAISMAYDPLVN